MNDTCAMPHCVKPRVRYSASSSVLLSFAVFLGGCIAYAPQELSAMSDMRLCELQLYSRVNLEDGSKRLLQDELHKRNVDCGRYVAQFEAERAETRLRAMTTGM